MINCISSVPNKLTTKWIYFMHSKRPWMNWNGLETLAPLHPVASALNTHHCPEAREEKEKRKKTSGKEKKHKSSCVTEEESQAKGWGMMTGTLPPVMITWVQAKTVQKPALKTSHSNIELLHDYSEPRYRSMSSSCYQMWNHYTKVSTKEMNLTCAMTGYRYNM